MDRFALDGAQAVEVLTRLSRTSKTSVHTLAEQLVAGRQPINVPRGATAGLPSSRPSVQAIRAATPVLTRRRHWQRRRTATAPRRRGVIVRTDPTTGPMAKGTHDEVRRNRARNPAEDPSGVTSADHGSVTIHRALSERLFAFLRALRKMRSNLSSTSQKTSLTVTICCGQTT
jgi:hypothetical protein